MKRRKFLYGIGLTLPLAGCSGEDNKNVTTSKPTPESTTTQPKTTTQETSEETSESTTEEKKKANKLLQIDWNYSDVGGSFVQFVRTKNILYALDTDGNLHNINYTTGKRRWYKASTDYNSLFAIDGKAIICYNYKETIIYNSDGEPLHKIQEKDGLNYQFRPSEFGEWEGKNFIFSRAFVSNGILYYTGYLVSERETPVYAMGVNPISGELISENYWYTSGITADLKAGGFLVGGSSSSLDNSGFQKINQKGGMDWHLPGGEKYATNGQVSDDGIAVFDYYDEDSEGAGILVFTNPETNDLGTDDYWQYTEQAPGKNIDILDKSIITDKYIFVAFIENPHKIKVLQFEKERKNIINKQLVRTTRDVVSARQYGDSAHVKDNILIGLALEGVPLTWEILATSNLEDKGSFRFDKSVGNLRKFSDSTWIGASDDNIMRLSPSS